MRRAEYSAQALAEIRTWVEEKRQFIPPKTPLGKALRYLYKQWSRLELFLEDGNIELTNNQVERELRRLVLGRKNWLFVWQDVGGERTAIILTVVGTCIAQGINPREYLHMVTKLIIEGWPQAKLAELLPEVLATKHPELYTERRRKELPRASPVLPAAA
jgi:transposase